MTVYYFDNNDKDSWNSYLKDNIQATFYHKFEWKNVIEKSFNHKTFYIAVESEKSVKGVLPLVHLKSFLTGSILCSMPFVNFGGIVSENKQIEKLLFNEAQKILHQQQADYIEFRHLNKSTLNIPVKTHKVSMTVKLNSDPDVLFSNFRAEHRREIRKAMKNGLKIKRGGIEYLDIFYNIISEGWRDLGTPIYRKSFFENILSELSDFIDIYVVFYQNTPIATALNGKHKKTIEGMWTYTLRKYLKLYTNPFLYWEMIKEACENGYENFHLGRSTVGSGSVFFKKKWNAIPNQLYWEYVLGKKTEIPELNVDNPKYKLAINTWKKLPVSVTQTVGPFIANYIP